MSNPLVSIIIPVYNGSNYLKEAIESALAQTYDNIEIIIVNDGSTDNTEEIAKSYGERIRYFSKENGGVASALNLALREMKGEYFSWLSHDDIYYPEKISNQISYLKSVNDNNVILYSDFEFINENSEIIRKEILDHNLLEMKPEYALLRSAVNGCTLLIPRKAFEEFGFFNEKLKCTQDYDMWYRMMKRFRFCHVPHILVEYRLHQMQDTNKNPNVSIEGDILWTKMIKGLSREDKVRLEGDEFSFYMEMLLFLGNSDRRKKTISYCRKKVRNILSQKSDIIDDLCKYYNSSAESLKLKHENIELEKKLIFITSSKFWKIRNFYMNIKKYIKR